MAGRPSAELETLLRVRRQQENVRAQELAAAHRAVESAAATRADLVAEQRRLLSEAGNVAKSHLDADALRRYYAHERHVARLIDSKDADIRALSDAVSERRETLIEAAKKREMIERLHARRWADYRAAVQKAEQRLLDEVAVNLSALARGAERRAAEEQ